MTVNRPWPWRATWGVNNRNVAQGGHMYSFKNFWLYFCKIVLPRWTMCVFCASFQHTGISELTYPHIRYISSRMTGFGRTYEVSKRFDYFLGNVFRFGPWPWKRTQKRDYFQSLCSAIRVEATQSCLLSGPAAFRGEIGDCEPRSLSGNHREVHVPTQI